MLQNELYDKMKREKHEEVQKERERIRLDTIEHSEYTQKQVYYYAPY